MYTHAHQLCVCVYLYVIFIEWVRKGAFNGIMLMLLWKTLD